MYRLAKQARREGENAGKLAKLVDLEKSVGMQKENFIMLSSHYLRTPFTIIVAGIDLLFSLDKVTPEKTEAIKAALANLNTKIESIFTDISSNSYLNEIEDSSVIKVKSEKIKLYGSYYLWLPLILIGGVAFFANFLFAQVAKIDINLINLLTEIVAFVILAQFFFSFFRKRQLEKAKNLKYEKELSKQKVLDQARNNFMKEIVEKIEVEVATLEIALIGAGTDQYKKEIYKGIGDLKQMVYKFTFLGNLESGKTVTEEKEVNVKQVFSEYLKTKEEEITAKNLTIELPPNNLTLLTDKDKFIFVAENIIDNAIKFSRDRGTIKVDWQEKTEGVKITVEDNGIGMSEEAKSLLFKPFVRGTSTLQFDYEGMGTNLYIAKLITNYLNGDVTVASKLGYGTRVAVTIDKKQSVKLTEDYTKKENPLNQTLQNRKRITVAMDSNRK